MHPARPRVERREARGEEDAARPGSFRWQSTAGSCYEVGGRKTQLGQGLHWVTSGLGKLRGREAASLRRDLRPARVEAAVSHSQLHRRHERPVEARRTPARGSRLLKRPSGEQGSIPWTTSRSGKAGVPPGRPFGEQGSILPVNSPGRLFGEQGSILCSRSRIRGARILQVSRAGNTGKA